jgi:hypothetical protein
MKKGLAIPSGKNIVIILLSIGIVAFLVLAIYFTFFFVPKCNDFACFEKSMVKCSKVSYVNDEPEASWAYQIKGVSSGKCQIEIKLLQAKKGELGIDKLNGYSMSCAYQIGLSAYPEKDLTKCSGQLKEELQTIIINKLHIYIINNIGQLNESIKGLAGIA